MDVTWEMLQKWLLPVQLPHSGQPKTVIIADGSSTSFSFLRKATWPSMAFDPSSFKFVHKGSYGKRPSLMAWGGLGRVRRERETVNETIVQL